MEERAYAKVNLGLQVVKKRKDGYHDLKMVMASIDLFDTLTIQKHDVTQIIMENMKENIDIKENLIYKAVLLIKERYHIQGNVLIHVKKRIPMGAGLAGGSSDAAATLRLLNRLWSLHLSSEELEKIGLELGSDVPFCITGTSSICEGRGEVKKTIVLPTGFSLVLVLPPYMSYTREVFQKCKILPEDNRFENMLFGFKEDHFYLFNDLEPYVATPPNQKSIQEMKDILMGCGCIATTMSGTGSTVIGIVRENQNISMEAIKRKLKNCQVLHCHFENVFI